MSNAKINNILSEGGELTRVKRKNGMEQRKT